jgi:hypothetical protein
VTVNPVNVPTLVIFGCAAPVTVAAVPETFPVTLPVSGPANPVEVKIPVDGTKESLVLEILAAVFPATVVQRGYTEVAVATSLVEFTGTVMSEVPLKDIPLMRRAFWRAVAVPALPVVLWLRVGKSPATAILKAPVPVVDFKIPVVRAEVPAE